MKKSIMINGMKYLIQKEEGEAVDEELVISLATDYFSEFDYIVGDYAYGKLRLKGFNDKSNKNFKEYNDISKLDEYIEKNCAYGCKYFVLCKEKVIKN